ncbi:arylsulfotransferase family protein [Dongia deserti]|uniref:arylsulfotransferase family protein n=1 Tax=Dongia deserti TaxID=2268030 RepID=UPI000E65D6B4|nr:arylsulfotransferase family protein [Dongia deserti]
MRWMALHSGASPSVLERILAKRLPLWLVAAMVIVFALTTVLFGWLVKRYSEDDQRPLATPVLAIASFPDETKTVFKEIGRILSGKTDYSAIRAVPPDRLPNDLVPVPSMLEGVGEGLIMHRGPGTPAYGWRMIAGVLQIDGSLQTAAVLLSPDLKIVHYWPLIEDGPIDAEIGPPLRKLPHGVAVLRDGSVIYSFDGGASLHRKDGCGRTMWAIPGEFHHTVTLDDTQETVWAFRYNADGDPSEISKVVQIATADGAIMKEFSIADVISANPKIDILELRRFHPDDIGGNSEGKAGHWHADPVHLNDTDPLPRNLADKFPMFAPGDLLISAREINLLFVLDPVTLAIKWWRVGATIRQHDGDWGRDGQISVFNNRTARGYSEIAKIDPETFASSAAIDGRGIDFYTRRRGQHQALPNGNWLITSTQQGRIIEVSPRGDVVLDFYNRTKEEGLAFTMLSASAFFPDGTFNSDAFQCDGR